MPGYTIAPATQTQTVTVNPADTQTTLFLLVPIVGFALIGLRDDNLTRYISTWWTWRRKRRVLTYRGEVYAHEFERAYLWRRRIRRQ